MTLYIKLGRTDILTILNLLIYIHRRVLFLDVLLETYLPGKEISMTTYREGDRADTGHRELLKNLGFAERELIIEYGYPTQCFTISPKEKEDIK